MNVTWGAINSGAFSPRRMFGLWSPEFGYFDVVLDLLICVALVSVTSALIYELIKPRSILFPGADRRFPLACWFLLLFLIVSGAAQLVEVVVSWGSSHRITAILRALTAGLAWTVAVVLWRSISHGLIETTSAEPDFDNVVLESELARINQRLQERRAWLLAILENAKIGIVATDEHDQVTLINQTAEELLGLPATDAIGCSLAKLLPPEPGSGANTDRKKRQPADEISESQNAAPQRRTILHDGVKHRVIIECCAFRVGTSPHKCHVLTIRSALESHSDEFSRLHARAISAANQGILITDPRQVDNPIIFASAGFERITGYSADEIVGRNCRFLQGLDSDPEAIRTVRESIAAAIPCTVELINYRKDETPFWNELSVSPVLNDTGQLTHFIGVQSDISARKALEEQLLRTQAMESIGRLAGGVAHDFNNMLTVINGCCDLAIEESYDNPSVLSLLGEIRTAGQRAGNLTQQLLALSRREAVVMKPLDLNSIIRDMEILLHRLAGESITITFGLAAGLGTIWGDRGRIEQVLLNLVLNARDAMPSGGKISIATHNRTLNAEPQPPSSDRSPGSYVDLEVADTGEGLDERTKARLFEPFFTTKAGDSRFGLGMTVVYDVVTQAGGHIEVESQPGAGAKFRIYFPRATDNGADREQS